MTTLSTFILSAFAVLLLLCSCSSEGLVQSEATEPASREILTLEGPRIESVRIESMPNGLARIEMVLDESGAVELYFESLESDLPPARVGGSWLQQEQEVLIEFEETELRLPELFCDYPDGGTVDDLILAPDGSLRYKAIHENDSLHETLYIWGIMCQADYIMENGD